MKYIGKFRAKDDTLYTVTISTNIGTGTKNIVLCTQPFVEELEGSDNSIFKPCKYSSATVRVLTQGVSDYMFDIFQSKAQDVSVVLTNSNGLVKWTGYVTPNLYDMGFESDKEEIEIECQDELSTLQYFKYQPIEGKPLTKSLLEIIRYILSSRTRYQIMYFPLFLDGITLDKLKISEQNFMGEDGDNWTMQEVLEEICKYLNVTCVASGDKIWFINYCSLNKVKYARYKIPNSTSTTVSSSLVTSTYEVGAESYSGNGGKISLLPSYNQISVISKINEYSDLLPDVFEEKYLSNANGEWNKVLTYVLNGSSYNSTSGVLGRYKFVTNPHYKTYYYNKDTGESVDMDTATNYPDLQNYIGATLLQASFEEYNRINFDTAFCSKTDKSLTNYILIHQHDKQKGLKVFSTVVSEIPETYIGKNTKMVIKGSAIFMDREKWMYLPTSYSNKKDDFNRKNLYLECRLKWGNYYFQNYTEEIYSNGYKFAFYRLGKWVTTPCTFRLFFNATDTDHINNKDFQVLDTSGDYNVSGIPSGYAIPLPDSATVQGSIPEFEIYTRGRVDDSYRLDAIWLKNFGIELALGQDSNVKDDEWETDTKYTNVINEEYVEEADDVECKINTWDDKAPTYSVILYDDGNNQNYLDTVTNLASGETYRLEEHIIYDFVNQYKQPSIQLDLNLKDRIAPHTVVTIPILDKDKKFIVDSYSRDYYNCDNNIKLIEKWNL